MEYVILGPDKKPTEKISNGGHPRSEVERFDNVGVLVPEPFVVFDFDASSDAETVMKIVEELDVKCLAMKTTRGVHLWFKSDSIMKNSIKTRCAIGLYYDVRSWGKPCYTVVKKNGEWREWIKTCPFDEIETVPSWLNALSFAKYSFKGMKDGDGRNQALYEYILVMQTKGYNRDQIRKTIKIINTYVFAEPMPDDEMKTILRDESFKDESELGNKTASYFDEDGKFKHEIFAKALCEEMKIVCVNSLFYTYINGVYVDFQTTGSIVDAKMIDMYPHIRKAQRAEVWDYIRILTTIDPETIPKNEFMLTLNNTRLDLKTGELLPFDENIVCFSKLPVTYDPTAYCADLDKCLNKVFCGDRQVINLFEEMLGYCLIKNCRFRKGFLFYGSGSNGKSTILNMLKKFFGEANTATIEMEKLSDRFKTAELENKLVNIGDDINRKDILDTGTLKKLFTGESVTVERKGQNPFTLRSYAKMVFSCNEIPRIADKTSGMYSRLMLIPFTAVFSSADPDFDPFIEDKVTTDCAMSYLLNMALRGLRRLLQQNDFTKPKCVADALEAYKTDNSTVLTWISEESITVQQLISDTTDGLFSTFKDWCARSDIKFGASIRTFHKEIEDKFGLVRKRCRCASISTKGNDHFTWKFVVKLD